MNKSAILGILVAIAVIAGFGTFLWTGKSGNSGTDTTTAAQNTPHDNTSQQGETKMATTNQSYDLTVDAEGLSKAIATMTLANGKVVKLRFYTDQAPVTAARIAQLISEGFYNDMSFHRVVPGFVVQGGDPTHTGTGGSGQKLKAEFNSLKHTEGVWSMARAQDPNSADSQFFLMLGTHPHLDGAYTGFGKVVEGIEYVRSIKQGDRVKSFTIQ